MRGNLSKRPINSPEHKPEKWVPPTPRHFTKQEKYWFERIAADLGASDILTHLDGMALELLIGAYVEWRQHRDGIDKEGHSYKTQSQDGNVMIRPHPQVAMMADAWKRLRAMLTEFGMTPASRSKVPSPEPESLDPFSKFLSAREE